MVNTKLRNVETAYTDDPLSDFLGDTQSILRAIKRTEDIVVGRGTIAYYYPGVIKNLLKRTNALVLDAQENLRESNLDEFLTRGDRLLSRVYRTRSMCRGDLRRINAMQDSSIYEYLEKYLCSYEDIDTFLKVFDSLDGSSGIPGRELVISTNDHDLNISLFKILSCFIRNTGIIDHPNLAVSGRKFINKIRKDRLRLYRCISKNSVESTRALKYYQEAVAVLKTYKYSSIILLDDSGSQLSRDKDYMLVRGMNIYGSDPCVSFKRKEQVYFLQQVMSAY